MKKRLLITRRLPEAVEVRASRDYEVVQNADDHQMTTDEIVEKAADVDAIVITITDKMREDVIAALPEHIKIISTFSIGCDHIDLAAAEARGIAVGNATAELKEFRPPHVYHAQGEFSAGILEGLRHYGWL